MEKEVMIEFTANPINDSRITKSIEAAYTSRFEHLATLSNMKRIKKIKSFKERRDK